MVLLNSQKAVCKQLNIDPELFVDFVNYSDDYPDSTFDDIVNDLGVSYQQAFKLCKLFDKFGL